jgi:hypothetical protein
MIEFLSEYRGFRRSGFSRDKDAQASVFSRLKPLLRKS